MPLDPDYLFSISEPFLDITLTREGGAESFRLHRPSLAHVVALYRLATGLVPDSDLTGDGMSYGKTVTALAILLTPPGGSPEAILFGVDDEIMEEDGEPISPFFLADRILTHGFGPWECDTDEAWGNPDIDGFLDDLSGFIAQACRPPEFEKREQSKPAKSPWPLLLFARCVAGGLPPSEAWALSTTSAFWVGEALSEAQLQGSSLVGIQDKLAIQSAKAAAEKALSNSKA